MFTDLVEMRLFLKRVCNLLPEYTHQTTDRALLKAKEGFIAMQRETLRKRLAADVEIKVRSKDSSMRTIQPVLCSTVKCERSQQQL